MASDSEDKKGLGRVEKEVRKEAERQSAKHQKGKQLANVKRPRPQSSWPDQGAGASAQETAPGVNSMMVQPRPPRMIFGPPGIVVHMATWLPAVQSAANLYLNVWVVVLGYHTWHSVVQVLIRWLLSLPQGTIVLMGPLKM